MIETTENFDRKDAGKGEIVEIFGHADLKYL